MKTGILLQALRGYLLCKLFGKKRLLGISWSLTHRCNLRCQYCGIWKAQTKELTTREIFGVLDALRKNGGLWISFTGGEPLIREDIGDLVNYASQIGLLVNINSNGILIPEKIGQIRRAKRIALSFDGPKEAHERIRGAGTYDQVMEAAKIIRSNNIRLSFATVLSKHNLGCIDYILSVARDFGAKASFQPATSVLLGGKEDNPIAPPEEGYKKAIQKLIEEKRKGNNTIGNSLVGLRYLYHWPKEKKIPCVAGALFCRVEPDGRLFPCGRFRYCKTKEQDVAAAKSEKSSCIQDDPKEAFDKLPVPTCSSCWCVQFIEFNYAFSLKPDAIFNALRSGMA